MLAVSHLVRTFGSRLAVDDLSFGVARGEVFGLLGPNGAGKTTTLRIIGALIPATSGSVIVDGVTMSSRTNAGLRQRIGFLTETPGLWDQLTVADNIRVYARLFGLTDVQQAMERSLRRFDLWERRSDRAILLSKGMKQKVALARALVHDPDIVLLDEPTANLDPQTARHVRDLLLDLRSRGRAVIVSTHNLDEIERMADRVALVSTRLIAIGTPAELRRNMFGVRLRIRLSAGGAPVSELAAIAAQAGGRTVGFDAVGLTMIVDDPDSSVPRIIRALVERGALVREACEDQPSLEEVYLRLLDPPPV